jgi:ribonuclease HI
MCNQQSESSLHLFLHCSFAASLWKWLGDIIKIHINVNSIIDVLQVTNRGWSPQCKLVITSAILNIVNLIWISRNNLRFNDVKPSWNSVTSLIIAHVSLAGNQTVLSTGSSIVDFQILKAFKVNNHPPHAPRIIEVIWHPPIIGWLNCNIDGSSLGNPDSSTYNGVFRNFNGNFLGCFAVSIGLAHVLKAELWGIIFAIDATFDRGWNIFWIESDSMVASWALKSPSLIPWQLRNRWESCLQKLNNMNFMLTQIYIEGNHCADKLASLGLSRFDFTWLSCLPIEIGVDYFFRNRSD